ncbi:hypothetical protein D3C87_2067090 [compost metagenome]
MQYLTIPLLKSGLRKLHFMEAYERLDIRFENKSDLRKPAHCNGILLLVFQLPVALL